MTDKEVVYKRAQDELFERLEKPDNYKSSSLNPYPDRLQLMIRYCESRRLIYVEDTTLRCASSFEQWLHLPTEEKLDDLLSISNFGEKTLEEVYSALESIGFHRKQ